MKRIILFASLVASLMMTGCTSSTDSGSSTSATSFDEVLATRRSVRSYDASKTISQDEVKEILLAAQNAPSWANVQPSKYYVAMSPEKIAAISELIGEGNKKNVQGAPVLIVSTYEKGKSGFFGGNPTNEVGDGWGAYDNGLSNAYFILKARAMGFDTLIMGMRDSEGLRSLLEIPSNEAIMAVISLGYRTGDPKTPGHRDLDEIVKFL